MIYWGFLKYGTDTGLRGVIQSTVIFKIQEGTCKILTNKWLNAEHVDLSTEIGIICVCVKISVHCIIIYQHTGK